MADRRPRLTKQPRSLRLTTLKRVASQSSIGSGSPSPSPSPSTEQHLLLPETPPAVCTPDQHGFSPNPFFPPPLLSATSSTSSSSLESRLPELEDEDEPAPCTPPILPQPVDIPPPAPSPSTVGFPFIWRASSSPTTEKPRGTFATRPKLVRRPSSLSVSSTVDSSSEDESEATRRRRHEWTEAEDAHVLATFDTYERHASRLASPYDPRGLPPGQAIFRVAHAASQEPGWIKGPKETKSRLVHLLKERRGRGNATMSALPIDSTPRASPSPSACDDPDATPRPARPSLKKPGGAGVSPGKLIRQGSMDFMGVEAPDLSSARSLGSKLAELGPPGAPGGASFDSTEDVEMDDVTTALSTSLLSSTPYLSFPSPRRSLVSSLALEERARSLSPEKPATETPPKPTLARRGHLFRVDVEEDAPPSPTLLKSTVSAPPGTDRPAGTKRPLASPSALAPPGPLLPPTEGRGAPLASPFDDEAGALSPARSLVVGSSSKRSGTAGGDGMGRASGRGKRVRRT